MNMSLGTSSFSVPEASEVREMALDDLQKAVESHTEPTSGEDWYAAGDEEEDLVIEEVSVCTDDLGPEDDLSYEDVWEEEIMDDDDEEGQPFQYGDAAAAASPVVIENMAFKDQMMKATVEEQVRHSQDDQMETPSTTAAPVIEKRKERYNQLGNRLTGVWKPSTEDFDTTVKTDDTTAEGNAVVVTDAAVHTEGNAAPLEAPTTKARRQKSFSKMLGMRQNSKARAAAPAVDTEPASPPKDVAIGGSEHGATDVADSVAAPETAPAKELFKTVALKRQKSFSKMLGMRQKSVSKKEDSSTIVASDSAVTASLDTASGNDVLSPTNATPAEKKPQRQRQKSFSKMLGIRQNSDTRETMTASDTPKVPRRQKSLSKMLSGIRRSNDQDQKSKSEDVVVVRQVSISKNSVASTEETVTTNEEEVTAADQPQTALVAAATAIRSQRNDSFSTSTRTKVSADGTSTTTVTHTATRVPYSATAARDESVDEKTNDRVPTVAAPHSIVLRTTPLKSRFPPAQDDKDVGWSKPEWATKSVLRKTKHGDAIRSGLM
jgi:hypothetical protein